MNKNLLAGIGVLAVTFAVGFHWGEVSMKKTALAHIEKVQPLMIKTLTNIMTTAMSEGLTEKEIFERLSTEVVFFQQVVGEQ
jgi:hypothetical protein